ncbi:hypothetical protein C347_06114 [Cryptococcus neoformans AD2-60a]|nr:hypothetical protein C347_06114 [Cryptococcus neoformans var. grubii AD2-60a]
MQAPQLRLNERQANPNPYVVFIRSLQNKADHTDAEDILRAVAAQMRTIMKERFMQIGTLEEAEFNRVVSQPRQTTGGLGKTDAAQFAGRNWNHGQSIELVLRGPSGRFLPMPYIISVMCHEMAHIEQMNHGPKFQKVRVYARRCTPPPKKNTDPLMMQLMREIKADVAKLQARGYYGDGFWSDGKRLADSVRMGGEGLRPSDFPEYICGVSSSDAKKARRGPRRQGNRTTGLVKGEASHRSGRQTEYRKKAGRRNNVDMGDNGLRLDGIRAITKQDREKRKAFVYDKIQMLARGGMPLTRARKQAGEMWEQENPWWAESNTRSKVAKSKSAAALRAEAAEARLRALAGPSRDTKPKLETMSSDSEDEDENSDGEIEEIPDPHLSVEDRKKEMDEMDEEEKDGLRGGWEDYITPPSVHRPITSIYSSDSSETKPSAKRLPPESSGPSKIRKLQHQAPLPSTNKSIKEERPSDPGEPPSVLGRRSSPIISPAIPQVNKELGKGKDVFPREDGQPGWRCRLCTFINLMDHGRCDICQARPDGTLPEDVQSII